RGPVPTQRPFGHLVPIEHAVRDRAKSLASLGGLAVSLQRRVLERGDDLIDLGLEPVGGLPGHGDESATDEKSQRGGREPRRDVTIPHASVPLVRTRSDRVSGCPVYPRGHPRATPSRPVPTPSIGRRKRFVAAELTPPACKGYTWMSAGRVGRAG